MSDHPHPTPAVAISGLGKRYGAIKAVDGLSLTVEPGEVVALSGASGGGKSTALALAMGFLSPSEGRVIVDGVDLAAADPAEWRRRVAWVARSTRPGRWKCNRGVIDIARGAA